PAGDDTKLRDVEVGVTGVGACSTTGQCLARMAGGEGGAISALGRRGSGTEQIVVGAAVIPDLRVAAEQARRPVGIPVVVEPATETPGRRQDDAAGTGRTWHVDAVGSRAEADALVGGAAAAEHREARRGAAGGDHVLGRAL